MNEHNLLAIISSIKSLAHKYDKETEFHHVAYHKLVLRFILFWKGYSSNAEYKWRFREQLEFIETYNRGTPFGNSLVATAREVKVLVLDPDAREYDYKARVVAQLNYLTVAFPLSSDQSRYGELISSLKKNYAMKQKNYPKTATEIYALMVAFEPTRVVPVSGVFNEGINFGNVTTENKEVGADGA